MASTDKNMAQLQADLERYRVLTKETDDPLATRLIQDIVDEMEAALCNMDGPDRPNR